MDGAVKEVVLSKTTEDSPDDVFECLVACIKHPDPITEFRSSSHACGIEFGLIHGRGKSSSSW